MFSEAGKGYNSDVAQPNEMLSRRSFLFKAAGLAAANLMVANAGVYAVGAVFKNLDGKLTAGAKTTCMSPPSYSGCVDHGWCTSASGKAACGPTSHWISCYTSGPMGYGDICSP